MLNSDVIVLAGLREGTTEGMGYPPPFGPYRHDIEYIQITESAYEYWDFLPTPVAINGSPKLVMRQMIDCAKDKLAGRKIERPELLARIKEKREKHWAEVAENAAKDKTSPIGGFIFGKELGEFVNAMGSMGVIMDSFSGSYAASDKYKTLEAGTSLDAGGWSGVGHCIPQGFGMKVARPDLPVLGVIGDGGIGISAMDLETCVRYNKPIVVVIFNNDEWIAGGKEYMYGSGIFSMNWVMENQPYHLMFEPIGVHGEWVTEPAQFKPALERAFNSGKPAIVNVDVDPYFMHPWVPLLVMGGYLRWFGIDFCKKHNIYTDAFWAEWVPTHPAYQEEFAKSSDHEKATDAATKSMVDMEIAYAALYGM